MGCYRDLRRGIGWAAGVGVLLGLASPAASAPTWQQLSFSTSPPGTYLCASVYDTTQRRMVVFGGNTSAGYVNTVWTLNLANDPPTWTQLAPTGTPPTPRQSMGAAYDPVNHRMVIVGGVGSAGGGGDSYAVSLGASPAWTQISAGPNPPYPILPCLTYHPGLGKVVLFGGGAGTGSNETWQLTGNTWSKITTPTSPPGRHSASLAYVAGTINRAILFGGISSVTMQNDTWAFDGSTWAQLSATSPPPARYSHNGLPATSKGRLVVFGGIDNSGRTNDVFTLNLGNPVGWTQLAPLGTKPTVRSAAAAVYDAPADRLVIFGGTSGSGILGDTWMLTEASLPAEVSQFSAE